MYNEYFGFREKPFNVTPDPRYFYTNPVYQEAYANLLYGIQERKGFIVLAGEVGTGKTTLLRRLMSQLEESVRFVFFYNTTLSFEELVSFACDELGLTVKGNGRLQKIQALNEFLTEQSRQGGTVVLLIDEAQNLTDDVLENLRLLSNLETATEKLLQIVLVGQTELDAKLAQPQLRQVKQRVALQCRLDRLKDREVGPFINYRLRVAGYEREDLFTPEAIREVGFCSKGIPRLINIICDNALLIAYATTAKSISAEMIREVARDLNLATKQRVVEDVPPPAPALRPIMPVARSEVFEQPVEIRQPAARQSAGRQPVLPVPGEREKRFNIEEIVVEKPSSAAREHSRSAATRTVALLVFIILLVGGVFAYEADLFGWLSDNILGRFKSTETRARPGLASSDSPPIAFESRRSPGANEPAPAAGQVEAAPIAQADVSAPRAETPASGPDAPAAGAGRGPAAQKDKTVVISSGTTISRIAAEIYGPDKMVLAMDILKEANPEIEDLNWVIAGQNLSLPPLTRETLLRKQSDDTYRLILGSFLTPQDAERFSRAARAKGYETAVSPHKVSNKIMLHRVEIRGLKNLETANRAWEVAKNSRWVAD